MRSLSVHSIVLTCLYLGGVGPLCAQNSGMPEKESDAIRGTVVNSVTHLPIGRALVYSPDNRFAAMTDGSGRFEFKLPAIESKQRNESGILPSGSIGGPMAGVTRRPQSLTARKPGFLPYRDPPFEYLSPGQEEVTIYLTPEAVIAGRVSLPTSDSFDKIQVELYRRHVQDGGARWTSAGTLTVRSDGGFRFADLPAGTYKLFTHELLDRDPLTFNPGGQLYGYPPVYFPAAKDFASGSAIQLSAGATFEATLSPTRREYYPVEISVANAPAGQPVAVALYAGGQGGPGYALGYNPGQQKILGTLPDGTYTLEVWSFGPAGETGDLNITVSGAPVKDQTVTLVPNLSISVNVSEEFTSTEDTGNGSQVLTFGGNDQRRGRYVQVWLEPADEFHQRQGASLRQPSGPDDESLVIENVQPGRYWVRVQSPRGFAASVKCGQTDLLHHPLVVSEGGSAPIELTIRDDGAQIEGVTENASASGGSSSARAAQPSHVYLIPLPESTGQFREVRVSPDGNFSSNQIPPGDYRVLAFDRPQPELEYRNDEAMGKYHSVEQVIRLLPGQKEHLRLRTISGSD